MSYQGIVLALAVTVAVGAAIYHYLRGSNEAPYRYHDDFDYNYPYSPRTDENPRRRNRKKDEDECTICLTTVKGGRKLLCGHTFHPHCIDTWLKQEKSCPNCRLRVIS